MNQVSGYLRRGTDAYFHFCPACRRMHPLPDSWTFNGNFEKPTFTPSFKHSFGRNRVCHYVLTDGILHFCGDCTHDMAGQNVPLPLLPKNLKDLEE